MPNVLFPRHCFHVYWSLCSSASCHNSLIINSHFVTHKRGSWSTLRGLRSCSLYKLPSFLLSMNVHDSDGFFSTLNFDLQFLACEIVRVNKDFVASLLSFLLSPIFAQMTVSRNATTNTRNQMDSVKRDDSFNFVFQLSSTFGLM